MKGFVIFGKGDFADIVRYIIEEEMRAEVVCYTVNEKHMDTTMYNGIPVVAFEHIEDYYAPHEYNATIAYEGKDMYKSREKIHNTFLEKGYSMENVVSSTAVITNCMIGCGNIVMQNCLLCPFSTIGDGNVFWGTSQIQHHNIVGSFNCIAPSVSPCGYSEIGNHCFVGNSAVIKSGVSLSDYTFVGAGAYVDRDTQHGEVVLPLRSIYMKDKMAFDFL